MAWLDDRAWCHPKLSTVSDAAFRAWVASICYSSGFARGGQLEAGHIRLFGCTARVRKELIDAGLWIELPEGGIAINDWNEHNDKRDAKRAADRERKRKQRDKERDVTRDIHRDRRTLKNEGSEGSERTLARAPDELWEALVAELGEPATKSERGRFNSALKELREVATPRDIHARCKAYRRKWPDIALTPQALTNNWTQLEPPPVVVIQPIEEVLNLPDVDRKRAEHVRALREQLG